MPDSRKTSNMMAAPYIVWAVKFILVPLGMIFYYGLTNDAGIFTVENITHIFRHAYRKALLKALKLAAISTAVCFLLAYPLCMILSRMKLSRQGSVITLFILPMWMNFLLRTLTWMTLLEGKGVINTLLSTLHLPTVNIINTPAAIVIGMVYNFLPFMILPVYNSLSRIDVNVINTARDLGAGPFQTFIRITFPLSVPGILSGITMVFIPALTTFAISTMLGGSKILLIGNIIEQEFTVAYDWHLGSGLSLVLMIFIIINMVISAIADNNSRED